MRFVFLASLLVAAVAWPGNLFACSCMEQTAKEMWDRHQHVFIATITDVKTLEVAGVENQRASFEVSERLKGNPDQIEELIGTTHEGGATCRVNFEVGKDFIILSDDDGQVMTCDGSGPLAGNPLDSFGWNSIHLARLRAIRMDEEADCSYSQLNQVNTLKEMALQATQSDGSTWRIAAMQLEDHHFLLRGDSGQQLRVGYGGCYDLGMSLELHPVLDDITKGDMLEAALSLAGEFWSPSQVEAFEEQLGQDGGIKPLGEDGFTVSIGDSTVLVHHKKLEKSLVLSLQHHY